MARAPEFRPGSSTNSGFSHYEKDFHGTQKDVNNALDIAQQALRLAQSIRVSSGGASLATPSVPSGGGGGSTFPSIQINAPTGLTVNGAASGTQTGAAPVFSLAFNGTAGSVPFFDGAGGLSQDNANFFWDATNKRLGLGVNVPIASVHVLSTGLLALWESPSPVNNAGFRFKAAVAGVDRKVWTMESDHILSDGLYFRAVNDAITLVIATPLSLFRDGSVVVGTTIKPGVAGGYLAHTGAAGITATITTAALTPGGTQGSQTFVDGILTAQTPAT